MNTVNITCCVCGKQKSILKKEYNRKIKLKKKFYCSRECYNNNRKSKCYIVSKWSYCGKEIKKLKSKTKNNKTEHLFCDKYCKEKAQYELGMFKKTKVINCYKCDTPITVDNRTSRKQCDVCRDKNKRGKLVRLNYHDIIINGKRHKFNRGIKDYLLKNNYKENKCEECGIIEWNEKPLVCQIHHKDGDRYNNKLDNLQMLCPNCHTQTPTWGCHS